MIIIQKLINCSGYGTSILAYDDLLEVDLLIRDDLVMVIEEGTFEVGEYHSFLQVLNGSYGFIELLKK
ncbi:hypothetical protein IAQ00_13585 [Pantoea ananatis]|uniref:hypothetical protein n=1 Tax=Pantoea ananas TaxID=553 RepID=UPI00207A89A2|nr:hypothetical protein [Pantoea ananatis]USL56746.1 hypothetical protein IAQ00_13585 [Pantoea ananatis]